MNPDTRLKPRIQMQFVLNEFKLSLFKQTASDMCLQPILNELKLSLFKQTFELMLSLLKTEIEKTRKRKMTTIGRVIVLAHMNDKHICMSKLYNILRKPLRGVSYVVACAGFSSFMQLNLLLLDPLIYGMHISVNKTS